MWLLIVAAIGLFIPNGLFIYWLVSDFRSLADVVANRLALAFVLDAFLAVVVLTVYFATRPIGRVRWQWFVLFSLVGGLGFGIPFFLWLNDRRTGENIGD
jgi:hypothetical protein